MSPDLLYTKEEKKINGVFYTPAFLAEYLAKKVIFYSDNLVAGCTALDPACGDSILLRSLANELSKLKDSNIPKIFGIDKDQNAIKSSQLKFQKEFPIFTTQFINTDGLFPIKNKLAKDGWRELCIKFKLKKGFDIILSNPPWGAELGRYNPLSLTHDFALAKGQFDIFDLFVELSLENLNENGIYGFILPDSVFSQEQTNLRCLLSRYTTIKLIARLGEKIFPEINRACVIIIGKKSKASEEHLVDCFRLSPDYKRKVISKEISLEDVEKSLLHKVPQSRFSGNENCAFDIDLRLNEKTTFEKIQANSIKLKKVVNNTRGAEISKKGIVCKCPCCNLWMPFPRSKKPKCSKCNTPINIKTVLKEEIILNHNGIGNIKLKVGEDLFRFTSVSKRWINTLKDGINYKDLSIYNGDKILVRKTGVGITASLDYENAITNQVVYILKLKPEYLQKLTLEFVLAVINSRAMTYFLIKKHGENEWKSHPYLTQSMLVNLPFPHINFDDVNHKKLIERVTGIIRSETYNSNKKNIPKESDLFIEKAIAYFFNLNIEDYKIIFGTLNSSEQLIPIKRLLNCDINEIFTVNGI